MYSKVQYSTVQYSMSEIQYSTVLVQKLLLLKDIITGCVEVDLVWVWSDQFRPDDCCNKERKQKMKGYTDSRPNDITPNNITLNNT